MPTPKMSRTETLTAGLYLALVAPTDEDAQRAAAVCDQLAVGMTVAEVDEAKTAANARAIAEDHA